jgi:outer membrane lipopolysaccharide assembly protein LptE/RlpB
MPHAVLKGTFGCLFHVQAQIAVAFRLPANPLHTDSQYLPAAATCKEQLRYKQVAMH